LTGSYNDLITEEGLVDAARTGAPCRITADQRCKIEALACQKPEEHDRPITNWTTREIAAEIIQQGDRRVDFTSPCGAAFKKKSINNHT
jgi:hypothetical protein